MIINPVAYEFRDLCATLANRFLGKSGQYPDTFGKTEFPKKLFNLFAHQQPDILNVIFSGKEPEKSRVIACVLIEAEFTENVDLTSTAFDFNSLVVEFPRKTLTDSAMEEIRELIIEEADQDGMFEDSERVGYCLMLGWAHLAYAIRNSGKTKLPGVTEIELFQFVDAHYSGNNDYTLGSCYYKRDDLQTLAFVSPIENRFFVS